MEDKKKLINASIILPLAIAIILFYFSPYIAVYRMKKAAEQEDLFTLSEYINFPAVKESLREYYRYKRAQKISKAKDEKNQYTSLKMSFEAAVANSMIDAVVTPENLILLMKGEKRDSDKSNSRSAGSPNNTEMKMYYENFNRFVINIRKKDSPHRSVDLVYDRERVIFWKLTALRFPNKFSLSDYLRK
jgi:hypothetical protein